ncbi:TPM domain-containing protein [Balneola sp. MJW-20]|uniref:TPM domain-containing protein n=1 Tax=Gracilimonas aurantiaca TaxID=3234185 RepID=UPI0034657074
MAKFLTKKQEEELVAAIGEAEMQTSGELRLHIEKSCASDNVIERAQELFLELGMNETEQRNGILVYVAWKDHKVAIWGGKGIHEAVGQDFWDEELETLITHFAKEDYTEGLKKVILQIGDKLKQYFPYQSDDQNELSDEISYNDED